MKSNFYVIGCGGTGSYLLVPLLRTLNNQSDFSLTLIDGDNYEESNFGRQEFIYTTVGTNKASGQAEVYKKRYPNIAEHIYAINSYINLYNISSIIKENAIIFTCVDNHYARQIIDTYVSTLNNAVHICAGNEEIYGNIAIHIRKDGVSLSNQIGTTIPDILSASNKEDRSRMSCLELSNLPSGGQTIAVNFMAASLMFCVYQSYLQFINKMSCKSFVLSGIDFDILQMNFNKKFEKDLVLDL